jgi:uncharacterized protein YggE
MNTGKNRLFVALGSLAAIGLLLAAFVVVWLIPRGPQTGDAKTQTGTGSSSSLVNSQGNAPAGSQPGAPAMQSIGDQPRISVHGTGNISAKPDLVNLQVGVQVQKDKLQDAQSEATTKMDAVTQQLKSAGIADKDIATAQYSVEPVMNYNNPNQPPVVIGFRVTNILDVKVRDISKAGKLIDDLIGSGANTVYGLSFGFSDPSAIMRQAREQAVADARAKADQLAKLGNVTLGAPILIEDGGSNAPMPPVPMMDAAQKSMAAGSPTNINPGQQQIQVDVNVQYSIK